MKFAVHWPIRAKRLHIGPSGIFVDGQVRVRPPLSLTDLAKGLDIVAIQPGTSLKIVVDDAWCRTLWIELPRTRLNTQERQNYLAYRFREVFGDEMIGCTVSPAFVLGAPWPMPLPRRGSNPILASAIPVGIQDILGTWAKKSTVRLVGLSSAWGNALRNVPTCAQGCLAVWDGRRMTAGAWSARHWLGWRSFVAPEQIAANVALDAWLRGLAWHTGPISIWCSGWAFDDASSSFGEKRQLPSRHRPYRPAAFDLRVRRPAQTRLPMRQKLIAGAALATAAAALYVSFPSNEPIEASRIVGVAPRSAPAKVEAVQDLPVAANESVDQPLVPEPPTEWPEIVGIFEDSGRHWVLFRMGQEAGSTTLGHLIGERFRVEHVSSERVVVLDLQRGERRESQLGWQGVKP